MSQIPVLFDNPMCVVDFHPQVILNFFLSNRFKLGL